MLCDKCKKREAKIYYTEIINGEKKEQHLCEECAAQCSSFHLDSDSSGKELSLGGLLSSILGTYYTTGVSKPETARKGIVCNKCGMTYEEFLEKGKFGCAKCYKSFEKVLPQSFKNLQGADTHIGKKPLGYQTKADKIVKELSEIDRLSIQLQEAVEKEEYEQAACLRDKIRELKKEGISNV